LSATNVFCAVLGHDRKVHEGTERCDNCLSILDCRRGCLLPLCEIDDRYRSSPIQVSDYLGAGKPTMSSPVAQFRKSPSLVSIARGAQGFAAALGEAVRLDTAERQEGAPAVRAAASLGRAPVGGTGASDGVAPCECESRDPPDAAARIEGHYPNGFFAVAR
jgi:hypothetical protein